MSYFSNLDLDDEKIRKEVLVWSLLLDNDRVSRGLRASIFAPATDSEIRKAATLAQTLYYRTRDKVEPLRDFEREHRARRNR